MQQQAKDKINTETIYTETIHTLAYLVGSYEATLERKLGKTAAQDIIDRTHKAAANHIAKMRG